MPTPVRVTTAVEDVIGALSGINLHAPHTEPPVKSSTGRSAGGTEITIGRQPEPVVPGVYSCSRTETEMYPVF